MGCSGVSRKPKCSAAGLEGWAAGGSGDAESMEASGRAQRCSADPQLLLRWGEDPRRACFEARRCQAPVPGLWCLLLTRSLHDLVWWCCSLLMVWEKVALDEAFLGCCSSTASQEDQGALRG